MKKSPKSLIPLGITVVLSAVAGCDMNRVDPGGGYATRTVVTVRRSAAAEAAPQTPGTEPGTVTEAPSGGPGTLSGVVLFDGPPPKLPPKMSKGQATQDPTVCAKEGDIPNESLIVASNGGLANVFVYLDKPPKGFKAESDSPAPVLDQKACSFLPHALFVRTGTEIEFKNSDPVPHNVQMLPARNPGSNNNMTPQSSLKAIFKKAEPTPFQSKCAIHPWMEFYTLVLDHPFAAITDADGKFEIPNLPAGKHKLRIWHERGKLLESVDVEIKAGQTATLERKFPAAKFGSISG